MLANESLLYSVSPCLVVSIHIHVYTCSKECTVYVHISPFPPSLLLPRRQVRWAHDKQHHTLASPYSLRLASVDSSSTCIVWDVGQAAVMSEFVLGNKPLVDMQWLNASVSPYRPQTESTLRLNS